MQLISLGSTHSLAASSKGKLYSWGWNDRGQCGLNSSTLVKELDLHASAQKCLVVQDCPFEKIQ